MKPKLKHQLAAYALLGLTLSSAAPLRAESTIILPDFGDSSGQLISPAEEQEFGKRFFQALQQRANINTDLEIQEYIERLGQRLAYSSDSPSQAFHFFVVIDPNINAFAGPGGYIGMNSGLMIKSADEGELASVMAHEIAHVTQRHLYRAYEASKQASIPATMATIAAILLGFASPELAQAALIATQAGNIQYQINFTRDNEQEADRVGMQILSESAFDPRSMVGFFKTLENETRIYGSGPPEFLRTHPLTSSRIADAAVRAEKFAPRKQQPALDYELVKAKLGFLQQLDSQTKPPAQTLKPETAKKPISAEQRLAAQYTLAMEHYQNKRYQQATQLLQGLIKQHPQQSMFVTGLAETQRKMGNLTNSVSIYQAGFKQFPNRLSILVPYAEVLLEQNQIAEAREILQYAIWNGAHIPRLYKMLAEAHYKQDNKAQAHRYLGEYHRILGDLDEAITQLRLAQKSAQDNFYMNEVTAELLNAVRKERQKLKDEE